MPKNYYGAKPDESHGDGAWIAERIGLVPIAIQREIADRYNYIYLKLVGDKKQRFRANTWLRETTEKYKCKNQEGYF